jgi:hypothetical protein
MIVSRFPTASRIYTDQVTALAVNNVANTPGNLAVTWTNPTSKKFVGTTIVFKAGSYPTSPTDGTVWYSGGATSTTITGLTGGETYYVRAFAKATNTSGTKVYYNTTATGAQASRATISNPVTNFQAGYVANTPGSLSVVWTAPIGFYSGVLIVYKQGSYPTSPTDGTQWYYGSATSTVITGLAGGTKYYVRAFVYNYESVANTNAGQQAARETVCTPLTLSITARTPTSITLSYTASPDPIRAVYLVRKATGWPTAYNDGTVLIGSWTTNAGTFVDSGLAQGTQYWYRVFLHNNDGSWTDAWDGMVATHNTRFAAGQYAFTSSQVWTIPALLTSIDIFCVGGGGATSMNTYASGGGGGYTATRKAYAVSPGQQYAITVGSGGAAASTWSSQGVGGGASSFGAVLSAAGGVGGQSSNLGISAGAGGSGGGGSGNNYGGNGGSDGATGTVGRFNDSVHTAGGTGQGSTTRAFAEAGNTLYAGGGGGSRPWVTSICPSTQQYQGLGGAGGGGNAGTVGTAGTPNTGGGAGASDWNGASLPGGSGVVVIRWAEYG